jgi:hypothetical protein
MADRLANLANTLADSALIPLIEDAKELQNLVESRQKGGATRGDATPATTTDKAPDISALPANVLEQVAQAAQQYHGADAGRAIPAAKERGGAEHGIG